jgi:2'-5' RNA ligase
VYYRIFFAIDLPEDIKISLEGFISKIKPELPEVRWVDPYNTHLTIRFVGNYQMEEIPRMIDVVKRDMKDLKSNNIFLEGLGAFPNVDRARVLWVGIKDDNKILQNMRLSLDKSLEKLGVGYEGKQFKPHLTLGRVKKGVKVPSNKIRDIFEEYKTISFKNISVDSLILFRSLLKPDGPEYWVLEKIRVKVSG